MKKRSIVCFAIFFMSAAAGSFAGAADVPDWAGGNDSLPGISFGRLKKEFSSPGKEYGSAPLWVWNTQVTNALIDSMLQGYKDNGFGGAFVHPRAGLITEYLSPDWFALWKHSMEEAKKLGLDLWIYDEDSYPSGFAGGHVPYTMPSSFDQGQMLEMHTDSVFPSDFSGYTIFLKKERDRFVAVGDPGAEKGRSGEYYLFKKRSYYQSPWYGGFSYTDLMMKGVTEQFIAQTMTGYERSVGNEFGKTVRGIFSDEPNIEVQYPDCIRWTPDLFDAFYAKWGYRLEMQLPSLLAETGDWRRVRHDYYYILLQLFIDRWSKPYSAYTAAHHLEWTGHYWEHEWPDPNHGPDNMAMYAWPQRPGIDMLFNQFDEHNVNAQFGNVRSVKELASVANQLGKRRTLCETYGGGGWELRFKDMKRLGDWEFALGINTLDQHLSFMSLVGARKYDYPQSFSYQTPWWSYYKWLNRYFARLSWALSQGQQQNKIVIIEPTTTVWMYAAHGADNKRMMEIGTRFQAYITRLEKAQVEYDLGSEQIIRDHGKIVGRQFVIGQRAYTTVVIPPGMENIDSATYRLLKQYMAAGGRVLDFEKLQTLDGRAHDDLLGKPDDVDMDPVEMERPGIRGSGQNSDCQIAIDPGNRGDLYHHRRNLREGQLLFLSNADIDSSVSGSFTLAGRQVLAMDLFTGEISDYPCRETGDQVEARFELHPAGSMLFFIAGTRHTGIKKYTMSPVKSMAVKSGPVTVHRPSDNTLTIDFCDVRIGDTLLKDKHIYDAADTVFKHYGFSDGDPWNTSVQFKSNTVARDTFSAGTGFEAIYHFTIGSGVDYSRFRAVAEQVSLWTLSVNGHVISPEAGQWWLDKGFGVFAAGRYMHAGENTLELRASRMSVYAEIEPVYILGDFGLSSANKGWRIVAPAPLRIGSWKEQGLPLYGQGIRYTRDLTLQRPGGHYMVRLHQWKGTMAAVRVNDSLAGIIAVEPYELDITGHLRPGKNRVEVEVIGSLKNLLGPHHHAPKPGLVSPWHWRYIKSYPPGSEYETLDYGLMDDFEIRQSERVTVPAPAAPAPTDTEGHLVNAHGAGVLFYRGTYYLFGEIKKGRTWQVPGQSWEDYRVAAGGVSCYSSGDLERWKYEGVALAPEAGQASHDLDTGRVIERPKVIYNPVTRQFVMWMHIDKNDYSYSRVGVAVSERPEGPYRYLGSVRPNGQMSRDMTIFQDGDDKAYLFYTSENNNTMQVCRLSADYLSPVPGFRRILVGRRREAPAVFKAGKKYYLITSSCSGWSPNAATYAVADDPLGPWVEKANPCAGPGADSTFGAQGSFVLPVQGSPDQFIFMSDRWNKTDLEASDYCWLPFTVRDGRFTIRGMGPAVVSEWRADAGPFAIVQSQVWVRCGSPSVRAYVFLRFYNKQNKLLMEYKTDAISSTIGQMAGHYAESPPGTSYLRYGVEGDPTHEGKFEVDSNHIETNVGAQAWAKPGIDADIYLKPFWRVDTMVDETMLMLAVVDGVPSGRLLFKPDKILSVRNFSGDNGYREGIDYTVEGKTLSCTRTSRMPFRADTSFNTKDDLAWFDLQSQWIVVTYTHSDKWGGPVPGFKGSLLPRTMAKLRSKKPLTILAYGMSITRGMDVSGYDGVAPYMPTYVDLFARGLRKEYGDAGVRSVNAGLPGSTVDWGAKYADRYINPVRPDLVILDFGMNDFWRLDPSAFGKYIRIIMDTVRAANPRVEFLLLSNMPFDPSYILPTDKNKGFYETNMSGYAHVLQQMEGGGVANLDMYSLGGWLYQQKKAKDCLVNPLHPNDWLARWYAQGMMATLSHTNN